MDGKPVEAAYDDFMKYLFAYLDVNGDGVLSKVEAERAPSVDQIRKQSATNRQGGSEVIDEMTAKELLAFLEGAYIVFDVRADDRLGIQGAAGRRPAARDRC